VFQLYINPAKPKPNSSSPPPHTICRFHLSPSLPLLPRSTRNPPWPPQVATPPSLSCVATSPHRRLPPALVLETRMLLPSSTGGTRRGELSPVEVVPGSWQCAWRAVRLAWGRGFPARGSTGLGSTSQRARRPWSGCQGCGLGGTQGGIDGIWQQSQQL
jgi:hypothetical protein